MRRYEHPPRVTSPDYDPVLRFVRSTDLSVASPAAIFQTATLMGFTSQSFSLPASRLAVSGACLSCRYPIS